MVLLGVFGLLAGGYVLLWRHVQGELAESRELAQRAVAAVGFSYSDWREQGPKLEDPKNTETFDPPFFGVDRLTNTYDFRKTEGGWVRVPQGTKRLEEAKTIIYTFNSVGSLTGKFQKYHGDTPVGEPYTVTGGTTYNLQLLFIDKSNPQRRRLLRFHDILAQGGEISQLHDQMFEQAYARAVRGYSGSTKERQGNDSQPKPTPSGPSPRPTTSK